MSEAENPPAFPRTCQNFSHEQTGMSLRDWFAGQAGPAPNNFTIPTPACADWTDDEKSQRAWSDWCVRREVAWRNAFADAMLSARHPTQEQG